MTRRHAVPILLAAALTGAPVLGTAGAVAAASAAQPSSHEMQPYPPRPPVPADLFDDLADAALLDALANADERNEDAENEDEDPGDLTDAIADRVEAAVARPRPTDAVPPGDEFNPIPGLGDGDDDDDDDDDCGGGCGGGGCGPGCEARKQVSAQAGELPFTGAPVGLIAAAGGGLLAVGATGVLLSVRRRRSSDAG